MSAAEKDPDAWIELQLLLLDNGAQIRTTIPDQDVWADIEVRLVGDADRGPRS